MRTRILGIVTLLVASLALLTGIAAGVARTAATWFLVDETGTAGHLWLMTDRVDRFELSPGVPQHWQVRASLVDPAATLSMQLRREGELIDVPDALMVTVSQCSAEWILSPGVAPACPLGRVDLLGPVPLSDPLFGTPAGPGDPTPADAPSWDLGMITHDRHQFFLATLWIPDTPQNRLDETLMGLEATVGLGFLAEAAEAPPEPPAELPVTGLDGIALTLMGVGLLGIVVGARMVRA